jgi:4-oxalomesaconate tautomerase
MGSPDPRQIDGIGGAHPLTSKVAVVSASAEPGADVDYLFLQVQVDKPIVSAEQPCGNILAGVGPFAIERGLVHAADPVTPVRVRMVNTGALAVVHVPTRGGAVDYDGDTAISGVPGTAARIVIDFQDTAGSVAPALLPSGALVDRIDGVDVTLIDNGMPVALMEAAAFGLTGYESPAHLESMLDLRARVEAVRLRAGRLMGLGDVASATVPKMCLVAEPAHGGSLSTRMFIPHRVHASIGVLAAVTVGTAAAVPGTVTARRARSPEDPAVPAGTMRLEHPTGWYDVVIEATIGDGGTGIQLGPSGVVSTARLLMDGTVFPREARVPAYAATAVQDGESCD